jgi:hypothetical protein
MASAPANPVKTPDTVLSVLLPKDAITLDAVAFDDLCHNVGVRMVHYRAIKCPVGMTDENDNRRTHDDHEGCSNGFIYKAIGRVTTMFTSNSADPRKLDEGFFDGSTVAVTFPRFYDSDPTKRVLVRAYDRFYLDEAPDILTATWDITHRRNDGLPDRVEFPVLKADHVVDSNGVWYKQGYDFDLPNGAIVWRANHGPALGTVYTVWYEYVPFWYCQRLVHEIRVIPAPDYMDASKVSIERLSFGAVLQREYIFRNQQNDAQSPDNGGRKQRATDTPSPQEYP